jgi:putative Ca2+/H+ antiporter (TMEM165/GDT1 family)
MLEIFLATYGAVLLAEIVGDKLLYTTGVLATRYRPAAILSGMGAAFMIKMAIAVAVGQAIAHLPRVLVALVTAVSFIGVTIALWRKPDVRVPKDKDARVLQGMMVAFATIFFSEWGDVGMVMAGTMAAKFVWSVRAAQGSAGSAILATAVVVWLGAVLAMVTKGGLAVTLGAGVRRWIAERVSPRIVRYVAVAAMILLGTLSVLETLGILVD